MAGTPFLVDDDEEDEHLNDRISGEFDDDVVELDQAEQQQLQEVRSRQPIPPGHRIVDSVDMFDITVLPGMCFELNDTVRLVVVNREGFQVEVEVRDFVRVQYITRSRNATTQDASDTVLHVLRLRRTKYVNLKWNSGELCILGLAPTEDKRLDLQRCLVKCSLGDIIPLPRKIIFTNQRHSALRGGLAANGGKSRKCWEEGTLFCRWKRIHLYTTAGKDKVNVTEEIWSCLNQAEADEGYGVPDAANILDSLVDRVKHKQAYEDGQRQKAQTSQGRKRRADAGQAESNVDVDTGAVEQARPANFPATYRGISLSELGLNLFDRRKSYGFGDHFCGIGGVSAAARKAGLKIIFGNDFAKWAAASYRVNFPEPQTKTFQIHCHEFLTTGTAYRLRYCAIIHFSPPCQPYSPAHTREGKNDGENTAALYSIQHSLSIQRPRFPSLEQTSGLKTRSEHLDHFQKLLRQFTDEGYSVRLRVMNLAEYDTPSQRKRLIVMACCPGETLPDFPLPTRGEMHGLPPFMTYREALYGIVRNDPWHTPEKMAEAQRTRPQNKPLAKWNETMSQIIVTAGPSFLHPSGRPFTLREGMLLMRFPFNYQLATGIPISWAWRGIGNAVPGDIMTAIYRKYIEVLKESDEKIKKYLAPIDINAEEEPDVPAPRTNLALRTKRQPQPKQPSSGRGFRDRIELSDSDEEELPRNPLRPLAASHRPTKKQRKVEDAFAIEKEAPLRAPPANRFGDFEMIDLTED